MKAGHEGHLWVLSDIETAIPINPRYLRGITDSQLVASGLKGTLADTLEFDAYIDAVNKANVTPAYAFANSARRDVTYAHLMTDPHAYRGDVVHIEGRLKRLRRFNPPIATDNVRDFYEGWMFAGDQGARWVCLIFTELPPGLQPAEDMKVKITCDGYFFKRNRFKADDTGPNQAREAPLIIGRTVSLVDSPVPASGGAGGDNAPLLIAFMVLVVLTVALAIGLTWWFRRSDQRVRSRIAGAMERDFQITGAESNGEFAHPTGMMAPNQHGLDDTPFPHPALPPPRFTLDSNESNGN
jgi:hypothetical protein